MSRYRASGDYAYAAPAPRWDSDRFERERDYRQTEEYYVPAPAPRRAARPVYEEERSYYEDDRYGPRGTQVDRRYYEEEFYDPRADRGQMIPFRPARPYRQEPPPPRPGLLRRQSSLDTFDRPPRRFEDYDRYGPPARPPREYINVPEQPGPRSNRYRPARPSRPAYYDEYQEYYDDVAIQDPEYYGDDGFREFREREWVRHRSRDSSASSHTRSRAPTEAPPPAKEKEVKEVKEEKKELVIKKEEKPYPRRGKTRMPKRLVHTKVLHDLGYSFYEEGEKTIIVEKALGPENINEVFSKSREYKEREVSLKAIEAPPPPPEIRSPPKSAASRSVYEDVRQETLRQSEVKTIPISEAPRSVREWDQLTVKDDARSVRSSDRRKSEVRSRSKVRSDDFEETLVARKTTVVDRVPSPSPSPPRRHRSRRRKSRSRVRRESSYDETEIIERKVVREEDYIPIESDSVHVGPLALVAPRDRERRSERDLKEQIRRLEDEQRALRRERRDERISSDFIIDREPRREERISSDFIVDRIPSRSRSRERVSRRDVVIERRPDRPRSISSHEIIFEGREEIVRPVSRGREMIIERRDPDGFNERQVVYEQTSGEAVEVVKDVRAKSTTRARAPSAGLIKSLLYTAT